jgi:hypothetical protein
MKKPKTKVTKSLIDTMHELGQKFGVKVTDMSERGVRAIGFLGGVGRKMAVPITLKIPLQIAEGANRRRKLVLTPVNISLPVN